MKKLETSIETLKKDVGNFYRPDKHHFIVMNAVDLDDQLELQWFFSEYEPPYEVTVFYMYVSPEVVIPTLKDIIPSAWVAEAELVDLIDIHIENMSKGFVLEPDSELAPLRKRK